MIPRTDLDSGHGGASGRYGDYEGCTFYDVFMPLASGLPDVELAVDPLATRRRPRRP